ncbi:MAG: phosphotransferase family protein [Myxococcota bacterium]|nr:phosphotransferase family protein [Myxococcota bacterium]
MAQSRIPTTNRATGVKEVEPHHRIDVPRLEAFLREQLDDLEGPLEVKEFRGGQSNPTYHLSDGHTQWVLRRKPPGALVASAHAVDREFRILSALHPTGLPVPRTRLLCEDPEIVGTMFFVMDFVPGRVLTDPLLPDQSPSERRQIYDNKIRTLARLHQIDHEAIGLGDYGKPGNYFARQIHRWTRQYSQSEAGRIPAMERLIEWLPDNIPSEDSTSITHGDYTLTNQIVHPTEPRVVAILDWELSTIGHPFGDLTYHLAQRRSESSEFHALNDDQLREHGIPTEDEYVALYCELTGRDGIGDLDFYLAFQLFRSAGIMHGIAGRVKAGTAAGEGAEEIGKLAHPLAEKALEHARKLGA